MIADIFYGFGLVFAQVPPFMEGFYWDIGDLPAGENVTLTVTATAGDPQANPLLMSTLKITNNARVFGLVEDANQTIIRPQSIRPLTLIMPYPWYRLR
jgi:hypothetical protein